MIIQQLRFKNLNSLVGEWVIDLTEPAFTADGIFAITGPTGAGKTTILDAICLALYGRTPRLNKVTRSGNEIMSRQTGECYAEVTFKTDKGRYCCHWSQHRARKKADGELQAPRHEISDADSGQIFEAQLRGVAERIEAATGMDFDRFTRSMLLAQGSFAAFLQAAPDERAPILEQITGTEIYSQISMRVHERQRGEKERLNQLRAETSGIVLLEPEQEMATAQELHEKEAKEAIEAAKAAEIQKGMAWLSAIAGLKGEIDQLADEAVKLQGELERFEPDRKKYHQALKAASLDGVYARLKTTRKEQADDRKAYKAEEETLPGLETSTTEQAELLQAAEREAVRVKKELNDSGQILKEVRILDQKIAAQEKSVSEIEGGCKEDAEEIDAKKKAMHQTAEDQAAAHENLKVVADYLEAHKQDEWLISGLAGVEEQLKGLESIRSDILQQETTHKNANKALDRAREALGICQEKHGTRKQELRDAAQQLQEAKEVLTRLLEGRLLREYRAEKDHLLREMAFLNTIAKLEDYRAKLEDGKPCPLCGAAEHPYAEGNVPVPDETEEKINALNMLIGKAEEQEGVIGKQAEAEGAARDCVAKAEKQESAAANDKESAEKALVESRKRLEKLRSDFSTKKQVVSAGLLPLGIEEVPDTEIATVMETLRKRLTSWQEQVKKKLGIEKQISDFDSELKRLDAVIDTQSRALSEKRAGLDTLKQDLAAAKEQRRGLYGDKHPDAEESRMQKAISDAEGAERTARDRHHELQQKWSTAKGRAESLKNRIGQREPELKGVEEEFSAALEVQGFSNEEAFQASVLPSEQISNLATTANDLDGRQKELKARQTDRQTRLAAEEARKVTENSQEELELQLKQCEGSLKELRECIGGLRQKLKENNQAKERMKERQAAVVAQEGECRRWDHLHALIGSVDGKKYRNFAQGLTFEMMIGHANRQLQRMSDRYLLTRDDAQPLELKVVDNYQAGEIRSTKNLSGGESFIVSLSLALGLSHMASKNVRVDSLFLDEGFGTLDEEALDTALETLASLQQEGKLIGVISHVAALKERISTQIQVTRRTGGRSQISGPGCGRVRDAERAV